MLLAGSILITLSSQVKLPSLLAMGFVTTVLAYRWGGNLRALLLAAAVMASLTLAIMAILGWASGLGFGWINTLGTANVVRSWMSPPTLLALAPGTSASCWAWVITPPPCCHSPAPSAC